MCYVHNQWYDILCATLYDISCATLYVAQDIICLGIIIYLFDFREKH